MRTPEIIGILKAFLLSLAITSASAVYGSSFKPALEAQSHPSDSFISTEVAGIDIFLP